MLFLAEGPDDLKQGINVPSDEPGDDAKADGHKAFVRYALKMATSSGKTTVMDKLTGIIQGNADARTPLRWPPRGRLRVTRLETLGFQESDAARFRPIRSPAPAARG